MAFTCQILFENYSNEVFYSGESINGAVKIAADDEIAPVTVKRITLRTKGVAYCKWIDAGNNSVYTGEESYIKTSNDLVQNSTTLPSGTTTFNFLLSLHENCPSSIEEDKGHIRYSVTVLIKKPGETELKFNKSFQVIKKTDLNLKFPDLKLPFQIEKHKELRSFFCCVTGRLTVKTKLPSRGFVAGKRVSVQVNVENHTDDCDVSSIEVRFVKRLRYHSTSLGSKSKEKSIVISRESSIEREQFSKEIIIPNVVPSLLNSCKVIDISYEIHVEVKLSNLFAGVIQKIPVIVGTIPYQENSIEVDGRSSDSAPAYIETPPPSYETCCPNRSPGLFRKA